MRRSKATLVGMLVGRVLASLIAALVVAFVFDWMTDAPSWATVQTATIAGLILFYQGWSGGRDS